MPIGNKPIFAITEIPRVACTICKTEQQIKIGFSDPYTSYSRSVARYVLELLKFTTIQNVSRDLGVGWELIKNIEKEYLKKHFANPHIKQTQQIAIDEISIGKGDRYFTLVMDLETGAVLHLHEGKDAKALDPFFKRLKRNKVQIQAVATDLSKAYIKAVKENLSDEVHVFDHFHVIKLFNDKLDSLRRSVMNNAEEEEKVFIKGNRWLLMKNPENLNEERDEKKRLDQMLEVNRPLAIAYNLKEQVRTVWSTNSKVGASITLDNWISLAKATDIKILKTFANTLNQYRVGILTYYDFKISTGPLEGTNNKIKTLQKRAYGYRDLEFYKLKIKALHRSKLKLVG